MSGLTRDHSVATVGSAMSKGLRNDAVLDKENNTAYTCTYKGGSNAQEQTTRTANCVTR